MIEVLYFQNVQEGMRRSRIPNLRSVNGCRAAESRLC